MPFFISSLLFFAVRVNKQFHNRLRLADSYCVRFIFWRAWASDFSAVVLVATKKGADNSIIYISNRQSQTIRFESSVPRKIQKRFECLGAREVRTVFFVNIRSPFWQFNQINVWSDFFFSRHLQWRTATNTRSNINVLCASVKHTQSVCGAVEPCVCVGACFWKKRGKKTKNKILCLKWNARWYHIDKLELTKTKRKKIKLWNVLLPSLQPILAKVIFRMEK